MKKQFLLMCAIMMAVCSYAQVWQKGVREVAPFTKSAVIKSNRASITPTEGQLWWGYMTDSDLNSSTTIGVGQANTTFMAGIYVPANHSMVGSSTIKAVRIYVSEGLGATMSNAGVWISKEKPANFAAADYSQSVASLSDGANDIELTTPYEVNNEGFYIGYTVTSSNKYPIMCCGTEDAANAFLISVPGQMDWDDLNGYGFGKLAFQILTEGATVNENSVDVAKENMGNVYGQVDGVAKINLPILNNGSNPLKSIDYTITTDGVVSDAFRFDLPSPIGFRESATITLEVPAEGSQSIKAKTLTITKANGVTNASNDNKAQFTLYSLPELIDRNVVVEEFTGTGCGWCPRGLVGMEKLRNTFGDRFVGIGIHQYNTSDAMYIANYAPVSFSGAPSCRIDRGEQIDPYYGSNNGICDDFSAEMEIPAMGALEVSGTFDEAFTKVNVTANAKPLFDDTYSLEFALVADGLTGTGSAWNQANYYTQYSASDLPADLSIFGTGGTYGKSSITGWVFNDVAIASSYTSGVNQVAKQTLASGESAYFDYTLTLPTKTTLKNALQKDQIYVVAILLDSKGNVVNAAKKKVADYTPTAIQSVGNTNTAEAARYTLDGRQISAPQHGINIVKMNDGSVRKVMVK